MPFRPTQPVTPLGVEIDLRPREAGRDDSVRDVFGAAFEVDNLTVSATDLYLPQGRFDPDFSVFEAAQAAGVQDNFDLFLDVRNEDEFLLRLERLKREQESREILDNAGLLGFGASLTASILDLPSLVPGASLAARGSRVANAARVGVSAGAGAAGAELGLQATQDLRTAEESLFAVGGSVILGAALGGAFGRAGKDVARQMSADVENLPRAMNQAAEDLAKFDADRLAEDLANDIEFDLPADTTAENARSAGAAANVGGDGDGPRLRLRGEGRFQFLRKFPGGYLGDVAEQFGAPGLRTILDKFSPLAPFTRADPLIRGQLQTSQVGRQVVADLAETPLQYKLNEDGNVATDGGSVETRAKYRVNSMLNQNLWNMRRAYADYMKDGPVGTIGTVVAPMAGRFARLAGRSEKLTFSEFRRQVGEAMFSADTHPVKAVRDMAEKLRGEVFNPIAREMVDVGFFEELPFKPQFGESYMTRRYRLDQIRQNETAVIRRLFQEFKKNQAAARLRLRDAEANPEAVKASDEHVVGLDDSEIEKAVQDTLRSIKGLAPGDSFVGAMLTNPMRARVLDVHDSVLLDMGILETDIGVLTESYIRSTIPRIEMKRKFESLTLDKEIQEMSDDYTALRDQAKTTAERRRLETEELARRQDIIGMRDRVLGIYDLPSNPDDVWSRAAESAKTLTYTQLLGSIVMSAIPDLAGIPARAGLAEFSRGVVEMATNLPTFAKNSREAAELLNAIEIVGNTRTRALAEINSRYMGGSMAERAIEGAGAAFSHAVGITSWNTLWKSISNVLVMSRLLRAADATVKGKATKKQKIALSENGITPAMAARMMKQFEKHGQKGNAIWYARAGLWDDQDVFNAGQMAVSRETDIAVVTPGQDKPLFMSTRVGGFFAQLKSFGFAANHRMVLSGIQRANGEVLAQFAMLFALGAVVSNLRADMSGRPRKEGQALIVDAIDRAGPLQIAFEANALAEIGGVGMSGLAGGELPSRFQARSGLLGLAGPTADGIIQALTVMRNARGDELTARDADRIARLIPGQNSPYGLLFRDEIREGIGDAIGVDYP